MLRRTRIKPADIENLLRWVLLAALLYVVLKALFGIPARPEPLVASLIVLVAIAEPILTLIAARGSLQNRALVLTLFQVVLVSALYSLTGGVRGDAHFLLYIVIALAATRLRLEQALSVATLIGLIFSTNLIVPLSNLVTPRILETLATDLLSYYAIVFIFHFFVTGRRETEFRRVQESALAEARRLIDQQRVLVRLSREISNASSLDDTLDIVLQTMRQFVPFKGGSIALIDEHERLYVAASDPPVDDAVRAIRLPVGQGIRGWIAQHQQLFYSPDLDAETRVTPSSRNVGGNALVKSFLGVPLVTRGHCIGVLQVDSAEPNAFGEEHQRLLETAAAQVAGVIENARLFEMRRDFSRRLQEVYETANELTSHFDLDFILERFAARAAELLDARYAAAATMGAHGQIANFVTTGLSEAERQLVGSPPQGSGVLRHIFRGQNPVRLNDLSKHPDAVGFPPHHPAMRTLLGAPLIARGETQGAIYVSEKLDGQPFTAEDEELLKMLTAGASAAVSNARLYGQLRRNIEQLYALHQIGQAIGFSLSWGDVIPVFNRDAKLLCGAEAVVISQWNTATNRLIDVSREGHEELLAVRERPRLHSQLREAARAGQAASLSLHPGNGNPARLYGYAAPLTVHGEVIGLAEIYSHTTGVIAPESSNLFLTLASQLAVSMENARLYGELQKREQQLRNFVVRLFQAQDEERRRMAFDIHDGLAQLIISADMHMSNFDSIRREESALAEPEFEKGLRRLKASLTEVRRVVSELRPSTLDDFGLVNTLRRHLEELAAEQGWEYSFKENLGDLRLDPTLETGAFRIVQESLNNTRKHSGTRRVEVELNYEGDHIRIRVQDWGRGFDIENAHQLEGHFGLSGMEERARLLGGACEVESRQGEGTTVKVELPCYLAGPTARV
jgi:signal transduction histidine kinase